MIFRNLIHRAVFVLLASTVTPSMAVAAPDDLVVVPRARANAGIQHFGVNQQQLEANLFNPHGTSKKARDYVESTLKLRVEELHRECQLSDLQRNKLLLAAANDTNRYFNQADLVLRKFQANEVNQADWNNFWAEAQPLQQKLARGLYNETSFFEKAIHNVLNEDQLERYEQISYERRLFRYQSAIKVTFVMIETSLPLEKWQQDQISNLLIEEFDPPKVFGRNSRYLVLHRMSKLPEDKIKSILNAHQQKRFQTETGRFGNQIRRMAQQGLLEDDDLDDEPRERKRVQRRAALTPADAQKPENDK